MESIGQYIEALIKSNNHRQSDVARAIGVQRQVLSYVIAQKRELSLPLALKLESFFNLPEGKLYKIQAEISVRNYKQKLINELIEALIKVNAFWSYTNIKADAIPGEELVEKVFTHLDLKDIAKLFELYPREYIRKVWREKMVVQGDYLFNLNVMIAMYYFDIKKPEQYLKRIERKHIKLQLSYYA